MQLITLTIKILVVSLLQYFMISDGVGASDRDWKWPEGIIPYEIDQSIINRNQDHIILQAIDHWNEKTIIQLKPRTNEIDFIKFVLDQHSCASHIGRLGGGSQPVSCDLNGFGVSDIIHEIGHSVGLFHEQSRSDRNAFVRINTRNISEGFEIQFAQENEFGQDLGPYDFGSIMHYDQFSYGKNHNIPTIISPPKVTIGVSSELSAGDISSVAMLYDATKLWNQTVNLAGISNEPLDMSLAIPGADTFVDAAIAIEDSEIHLLGVDIKGQLWHTFKNTDGNFSTPTNLSLIAGDRGGMIVNVSCAVIKGQPFVCVVNNDGQIWFTKREIIRNRLSWTTFESIEDLTGSEIGFISYARCINVNDEPHILTINDDGQIWYTANTRNRWLRFLNIGLQTGENGYFTNLSCSEIRDEIHLCAVDSDGEIWHTKRNTESEWARFSNFKDSDRQTRNDLQIQNNEIGDVIYSNIISIDDERSFGIAFATIINHEGRLFKRILRGRWTEWEEFELIGESSIPIRNLGFYWRNSIVYQGGKLHMIGVTIP